MMSSCAEGCFFPGLIENVLSVEADDKKDVLAHLSMSVVIRSNRRLQGSPNLDRNNFRLHGGNIVTQDAGIFVQDHGDVAAHALQNRKQGVQAGKGILIRLSSVDRRSEASCNAFSSLAFKAMCTAQNRLAEIKTSGVS